MGVERVTRPLSRPFGMEDWLNLALVVGVLGISLKVMLLG